MSTFSSTKAYSPWKPDSDDKENDDLFIANILVADVPEEAEVATAPSLGVQDVHSLIPEASTGKISLLLEAGNNKESKPKENTGMIALLLEASNTDEVVLIPDGEDIPERRTRGKQKSFAERLEDLKRFKIQHGHTKVTSMDDRPLASWCSVLRFARKKPEKGSIRLTEYQITQLDSIGFHWTSMEYVTKTFDQRIADLEEYKRINGHVNVRALENNRQVCFLLLLLITVLCFNNVTLFVKIHVHLHSLGQFCSNVRYARRKNTRDTKVKGTRKLTEDRIARLDALGFEW